MGYPVATRDTLASRWRATLAAAEVAGVDVSSRRQAAERAIRELEQKLTAAGGHPCTRPVR